MRLILVRTACSCFPMTGAAQRRRGQQSGGIPHLRAEVSPDNKVDLLTHSMGGLVARRHIASHPTDHHIGKLVTVAAPWLGAPLAIEALESGEFFRDARGLTVADNATVQRLVQAYTGAHELLPSRSYFDLADEWPMKEEGWDFNGDHIGTRSAPQFYNWELFVAAMNQALRIRLSGDACAGLPHDRPG